MSDNSTAFDPYQVFEVTHKHCAKVIVRVICGRKITKGSWAADLMDIPDPYVILEMAKAPQPWRKTSVKDNDINPEWNESFIFYVDPEQEHTLEMSLMDANYTKDEHLASRSLPLVPLPYDTTRQEMIQFNETSEVQIEVSAEICANADLRYSLMLCQEEKAFIEARKRKVHKALKKHFGFGAPRSYREVPVIAVIGSGGGFRAMTGYSGAFSALAQLGVLDMTTYVGGLSGSAWYISQLYSHPEWPQISPGVQREELKHKIDHSFLWLFQTHSISFAKQVWRKRSRGEPVSFTDLFGHLVGNTIINDRLDAKLSDQKQTVAQGECPMPLYTCLHVKKSVSAMVFHEWMEFSPFEIGLAKYGTFMKSEQFGCKFFMGSIARHYAEPPLHFLQGIWGSAFCIQFKRLFQDDKNVDCGELMRREKEELQEELLKDMAKYDAADSESSDDDEQTAREKGTHGEKTTGGLQRKRSKSTKMKQKTFWDGILQRMMESSLFQTIELRAAQVFNCMRGLSLNNMYPFSPFTKTQEEEDDENNTRTFGGIFEMHPTDVKKLYVVDSGLTFNSPYPVVLRPQREVDIIISFDFSARPSDDAPPFKELLLAAKWAELNKVPFPPIDPTIIEKEGLKECYVFKHPWDPNCPIVLHFCLININFRRETRPGVARATQEEVNFGNFSIFDDPAHPYSTFKFTYKHLEFDRLSQLMEYNTLKNQDVIFDNISTCIKRRRRFSIRRPCKIKDITRLSLKTQSQVAQLEKYIAMVEKVNDSNKDKVDSGLSKSKKNGGEESLEVSRLTERAALNGSVLSNEEGDATSVTHRPVSSPVRFLDKNRHSVAAIVETASEKPGQKAGDRHSLAIGQLTNDKDQEPIINSRLHRSTVSLKSSKPRSRLTSAMSRLEEGDEEEEGGSFESPTDTKDALVWSDKTAPSKGVLSRSRPVSVSMRPNISSERRSSRDEEQFYSTFEDQIHISVNPPVDESLASNNGKNFDERGEKIQNSKDSNGLQIDTLSDLPPLSPRLAKRANAVTREQRKCSIDTATAISNDPHDMRQESKDSIDARRARFLNKFESFDEWVDAEERFTEL